ncbi:MAG: hypothetical protein JWL86_1655 [Rhizobium sp.]|nr:hypothetical protein [Rhizobium sp.]
MSEPVNPQIPGNGPVVGRIVLAVLCMIPGVIGLIALVFIAAVFITEGFSFVQPERDLMVAFIIGTAFFIGPSVIAIGIILRYARWKKAPTASLWLAGIFLVADVIGTGLIETTIDPGDSGSWQLLIIGSAFGLITGSLPPFLHWWNAKPAIS